MFKSFLITAVFWLMLLPALAQFSIRGRVTTPAGKAIPSASVFLSNTSIGTVANSNGFFELHGVPAGRYELIASSMGFETKSTGISTSALDAEIIIILPPKAEELQEVIVGSYDRESWAKWGRFFLDNFIGTTYEAAHCTLKNPEVLRFRNYTKQRKMIAYADETLIIENRALGYNIKYQLEQFEYDFKTKILIYAGYPLFEPMEKKGKVPKSKWLNNRENVYYGSKMHFMRSLYRNTLQDEGFEMHRMVRMPNIEKHRVAVLMQVNARKKGGAINKIAHTPTADSTDYYDRILRQPDFFSIVDTTLLAGDSIAYAINETTAGVFFSDFLQIIYTAADEDILYIRQLKPFGQTAKQTSTVSLLKDQPIEVLANGSFFEPLDLLIDGYWAWSDKMANMLPYDYKPPPAGTRR